MDFAYTDEQQMLADTTRRLVFERYPFEYRHKIAASDEGWSRELWARLADMGLLAINVPEEDGGIGAGPVGTMLVSQAVGHGLLLEPFWASAVVATRAIATLGSPVQRAAWLPGLAAGESIAVLAHDEAEGFEAPEELQTTASPDGEGWRLEGRKSLVYHAPAADLVLVSARIGEGTGVFAVPAGTAGMTLSPTRTVDGQVAADVELASLRLGEGARLENADAAGLQAVLDYGLAALCAEAFGAMDRLLTATIDYSRERRQFGVPIGSFQALQHRMADLLMHREQARSMGLLACARCEDPDPAVRRAALSAAKVLMGQAARAIGQEAVQLHGGMGMTDELDVSHLFKRLLAFELRGGGTDRHLARYRRQLAA